MSFGSLAKWYVQLTDWKNKGTTRGVRVLILINRVLKDRNRLIFVIFYFIELTLTDQQDRSKHHLPQQASNYNTVNNQKQQ